MPNPNHSVPESLFIIQSGSFTGPDQNTIFHKINLHCPLGEISFCYGPSGSGRTTLLRIFARDLSLSEGSLWINYSALGLDEVYNEQNYRAQIGWATPKTPLIPDMTILENILLTRQFSQDCPKPQQQQEAEQLLSTFNLLAYSNQPANACPEQVQILSRLVQALFVNPKVIFIDNLMHHLSKSKQTLVLQILSSLCSHGKTCIITSHQALLCHQRSHHICLTTT